MGIDRTEFDWQSVVEELEVSGHIRQKIQRPLAKLDVHHAPTAAHCRRVGVLAARIGQQIGLPPKPLFYGGSLHDRGKLLVARELLDKKKIWTPEDARALRNHPIDGYNMTMADGMVVTAGLVVRHHTFQPHKYPAVVPEAPPYLPESFMRMARMVALADYYDAAHRNDSAGNLSGPEIQQKILAHNQDEAAVVMELYEAGIFTMYDRAAAS